MKILMVTDSFDTLGGVETYLSKVINEFKEKGHEVRLLSSDSVTSSNSYVTNYYSRINKNSLLKIFPYLFHIRSYRALKEILKEFKPDVVHLHFTGYHSSPSIFLPLKKIPSVYTTHSHELFSPITNSITTRCKHDFDSFCIYCLGFTKIIPEKIRYFLIKSFIRNIDLFIAPSKHHTGILKKHKLENSVLLSNGILTKLNKPGEKKKMNLLYIGRITEEKGVKYAILAFEKILKKYPNTTLTIVGDGPEKNKLVLLAKRLGLIKAITFTGHIPNDKIINFFENASIVLVPSIYPEAFVLVGIEAMSMSKVVIGSNIGGIPEWLFNKQTGFLVEPKNAEEIADKAITLLSNKKLLDQMSNSAYAKAKLFTVDRHVSKLEKIYQKVINKYEAN